MKKILFVLIILIIPSIQSNAIKLKQISEKTQLLEIEENTKITEVIEIENNLFIRGKSKPIKETYDTIIIETYKNPRLEFEGDGKIIAKGIVWLKEINIVQYDKIDSQTIIILPDCDTQYYF